MAVYRFDLQMRIPWADGPQPYYYWTNLYYGDIRDPDDLDNWQFGTQTIASLMHNVSARQDWVRISIVSSGTVVANNVASWPVNGTLTAEYPAIENTVFVKLLKEGRQIGYKRFRSPVMIGHIDGDRLTPTAHAYYTGVAENFLEPLYRFCTVDGVFPDAVSVSPYIHSWQMRHGTKRSARRRLHA